MAQFERFVTCDEYGSDHFWWHRNRDSCVDPIDAPEPAPIDTGTCSKHDAQHIELQSCPDWTKTGETTNPFGELEASGIIQRVR